MTFQELVKRVAQLEAQVAALQSVSTTQPPNPPAATAAVIAQQQQITSGSGIPVILRASHGTDEAGKPRWAPIKAGADGAVKIATE